MIGTSERGREFASAAQVEGIRIEIPVAVEQVLDHLRQVDSRLSLRPETLEANWHWLAIECWRVSDGRLVVGGIDQHALWARALPFFGKVVSHSLTLGAYHELMLSIPSVQYGGDSCSWVVGMVTDSTLARQIDQVFGYGFNKSYGSFKRQGVSRWRVDSGGAFQLDVDFAPLNSLSISNESWLNERWSEPLLGRGRASSLVQCHFERRVNPGDKNTRDANGVMSVGGSHFDAWLCRDSESAPAPRASVFCSNTRITYPRRLT